jgi:hypothetical protein
MVGKRVWEKIQLFDNKKRLICSATVNYEKNDIETDYDALPCAR